MLTEQRYDEILKLLHGKGNVTVNELKDFLNASESTIRRDLNELHKQGKLVKVFGGAVLADSQFSSREEVVSLREDVNKNEKIKIAKYAASLIQEDDFIYLDAGTTTGYMIDFISIKNVTFVTNAVSHGKRLAELGAKVILIGGELKSATEAIVGNEAYVNIQKYNFTIGFWGTNGVSRSAGFTTPEINEAMTKQCAMNRTKKKYVLCDHTKFHSVAPVTFADFDSATVITDQIVNDSYGDCRNVIAVDCRG